MDARLKKLGPGLSYNDFRAAMKGTGKIIPSWKRYKELFPSPKRRNSPRAKAKSPKRSPQSVPKKLPGLKRSDAMTGVLAPKKSNIGPSGLPMSPTKKRTATVQKKKKPEPAPVSLYLEQSDAVRLAEFLSITKLFQVLAASKDLKDVLLKDLNFWVTKYRNTFGYTFEFVQAKSTKPLDWMNLTKKRAIAMKLL